MMVIPRYDSPQVAPGQVDGARLNPNAAPNLMGALGQGLQGAVAGFDAIQLQAQTIKGEEALTKLRERQQEYSQRVQGLNGKKAFDPDAYDGAPGKSLHDTALGWFDGAVSEVGTGLTGHAQQVFRDGAARFRLDFSGHVRQHETRESGVVAKDTYQGVVAVEDQNIAQNGISVDGRIQFGAIDLSIARKVFAANQLSDWLGEGPEMRKARELEVKSSGYALVLEGLLQRNNIQGAQVFFDAHRDSMDKRISSIMEDKIRQVTLSNDVQTMAQEVAATGKPLDQQLAWVDGKTKGNASLQKALSAEVEHRFTVAKHAQESAVKETTGKLWDMRYPTLPGSQAKSLAQIMKTPEWASLNGTQRNALVEDWERHGKRNENDPATQVAKFATFQKFLDDPKSLMGMSDAQIASYTGSLGPELAMRLMEAKRKAAGNLENLKISTLNDIGFNEIVGEYGIKAKGTLSQENLARLGLLRSKTMDAIRYEQEATGKVATPERKEEILRGLLVDVSSKRKGDIFNWDRPLFEVKDFTELAGTDEEKQQAIWLLVQADSPTTPANVQTMLDAIRAKKPRMRAK